MPKPFARSVEEAEQIVGIAEAAGVRLMVTENWRWLEPFQIIKKLLAENIVGNMNVICYTHTDFYSPRFASEKELPQPFFRDMPKLLFYEMGVHWLDGVELLIHIGINTVSLKGKHFTSFVSEGDTIQKGDKLVEFDPKGIEDEGYDITTSVIVTNTAVYTDILVENSKDIHAGDRLLKIR
ncbi:PTS glucose transporter subunit IIA [Paenibacillus polymyxa]|uniref:PTS sugar transporter subunit IIA n=1 Tax=Paenibacillus polymyxa TaxID=1406 RepID=UPI003CC80A9C